MLFYSEATELTISCWQMMYAYSFQSGLTLIFGPIFRTSYMVAQALPVPKTRALLQLRNAILSSADLQIVFWEANGFLIGATAVAALVRLDQQPTIFEIAEMQALMLAQLCSLVVVFFCLLHPVSRWWQRFSQFVISFAIATVALSLSHLGNSEADWLHAGQGCNSRPAYKRLSPVPVSSVVVYVTAVLCVTGFIVQSLGARYPAWSGTWTGKNILRAMTAVWIAVVLASMIGMFIALATLWNQRNQLHSLVGEGFEDNLWGFGQVAALFTWLPIPVEMSYRFNDWLTEKSVRWRRWRNRFSPFRTFATGERQTTYAPVPATTSYAFQHHTDESLPKESWRNDLAAGESNGILEVVSR